MTLLRSRRPDRVANRTPSRGDGTARVRTVLGFLTLLSLLLLSLPGCGGSGDPLPTTTSSTLNPTLAPFKRAYQNLSALSTYSVSMQTWKILGGTVTNTAWLDDRERLIRVDRETVPAAGAAVEHTYTSIAYSRFADPDLQVPVPPVGYEPSGGSTSTTD